MADKPRKVETQSSDGSDSGSPRSALSRQLSRPKHGEDRDSTHRKRQITWSPQQSEDLDNATISDNILDELADDGFVSAHPRYHTFNSAPNELSPSPYRRLTSVPEDPEFGYRGFGRWKSVPDDHVFKHHDSVSRHTSVTETVTLLPRMRAQSVKVIEIEDKLLEPDPLKRRLPSVSEEKSHWTSLWLANILCFFAALSFTLFIPTVWPFLHEMDPDSTEEFSSYIVAAYSVGQAIASPAFGLWSNRWKQTKIPAAIAILIMFVSNIIYCFIEGFPVSARKWVFLGARFLCGMGAGVIALLRAYAATASTAKDRSRAISLISGAYTLGLVIGPGIQAAFTPIGRPGWVAGPFHLDVYTAAAVFSAEEYAGIAPANANKNPFYALPKYDKTAVCVSFLTRFILMCALTNIETLAAPFTMAMWNWGDETAAEYNSLMLAGMGLVTFVTYALWVWKKDFVNERIAVIFGFCLFILYYVLTFPWPFFTGKLGLVYDKADNVTNGSSTTTMKPRGCNMDWCDYTPEVPMGLYIPCYVVLIGIGFPVVNVSLSTLFSKILGPRRQGTMQGFLVLCGSAARAIGPVAMMVCFTKLGPSVTWEIQAALFVIGILAWVFLWRRMVPLKKRTDLKPGQKYEYKKGYVYKF